MITKTAAIISAENYTLALQSDDGGETINHPTLPHAGLPENRQNTKQRQILPTRETEKPSKESSYHPAHNHYKLPLVLQQVHEIPNLGKDK
jgi:hypothetical protein